MISLTIIVYVQSDVSWSWGLGIPAFMMLLSCIMFFMGSKIYVKVNPEGSPLTNVVQVIVAAVRKKDLDLPEEPWSSLFNHIPKTSMNSKLRYTEQFRFLNKAAIATAADETGPDGSAKDPWKLCSLQKVEEVKCLIRVLPIWSTAIIYYVALVQQQTYVVFQATQSNRHLPGTNFKIPPASYTIFSMIGLTVWIPLYDQILIPFLRRITKKEGGVTILQKMGTGMVLAVVTMIISGQVEQKRRHLAITSPVGNYPRRGAISSLSGLWLVPQLTLIGLSEAFTIIGQIEFYYKQFPENMRSIGGSFSFVGIALSNYLSSFLISVVHKITSGGAATGDWLPEDLNKGKLDCFYYLVAALGVLNFGVFLVCARWYKYKETAAAADNNTATSLP